MAFTPGLAKSVQPYQAKPALRLPSLNAVAASTACRMQSLPSVDSLKTLVALALSLDLASHKCASDAGGAPTPWLSQREVITARVLGRSVFTDVFGGARAEFSRRRTDTENLTSDGRKIALRPVHAWSALLRAAMHAERRAICTTSILVMHSGDSRQRRPSCNSSGSPVHECQPTALVPVRGDLNTMARLITRSAAAFGVVLALSACTNPYDPGQRALGGAAIGAGAGAAIGGAVGGWHGAGIGALAGGALGAVTGAVTTPHPPPAYYSPPSRPAYNPPSY